MDRHTAPHGAARIAEHLLWRAKRLCGTDEREQRVLLQQATLAGEAKEILGGLSPTTFLEALSLQNAAEIRAEASFAGTESQINPICRLSAFEAETGYAVSAGAREVVRSRARLNYLIQQLNGFRRIYNSYEEVTAAEACLHKMAKLQRLLLRTEGGWVNWFHRVGLGYSDLLTRSGTSLAQLLMCDLIVILSFSVVFLVLYAFQVWSASSHPLWLSLSHSTLSFMELQSGLGEYDAIVEAANKNGAATWVFSYRICLFVEIVLAYINQGLLIAMLYRRVTRRTP